MKNRNFIRNIEKHRRYYFTSIFGLIIGITTFLLVSLFINHEYKFDNFHSKSDRIVRIAHHFKYENTGENSASCPAPVSDLLKNDYPNLIESSLRLYNDFNSVFTVESENRSFSESKFVFADSTLFKVFDFNFVKGDAASALNAPNKIVLTESIAEKYFGNRDPIGQLLKINNEYTVIVTAVIKDLPSYSHFKFDMYCSMQTFLNPSNTSYYTKWHGNPYWTYICLKKGVCVNQIDDILPYFAQKNAPGDNLNSFSTQLLTNIHFHSNLLYEISANRNIHYIKLLIAISILVLLMSFINYINLSVSHIKSKLKQIAIKKLIGLSNLRLIKNVFSETVLVCFVSFLISIIITYFSFNVFSSLMYEYIDIHKIIDFRLIKVIATVFFILVFFSSIYPTIVLISLKPINIIGKRLETLIDKIFSQKLLVITQFLFSIFLVTGSIITLKQVNYLNDKPLGFEKENILIINIKNTPVASNITAFLESLNEISGITDKTYMSFLFGYNYNTESFSPETDNGNSNKQLFPFIRVHEDFVKTFDIKILEGRDFSKELQTDMKNSVLINESMVKHLGWTNEGAIGKRFTFKNNERVIGVIEDYHIYSLHKSIQPLVIDLESEGSNRQKFAANFMAIRIEAVNTSKTIKEIEKKWMAMASNIPFTYSFLDDRLDHLYRSEKKLSKMIVIFTIITVLLACMGIFALSIKIAMNKTKEIGVRKVVGANMPGILLHLNKSFLTWVLIALIISYPLSFYVMKNWLENFCYKTNFSWWIYLLVSIIAILISVVTVSFQSWKVANKNPVEALRYE